MESTTVNLTARESKKFLFKSARIVKKHLLPSIVSKHGRAMVKIEPSKSMRKRRHLDLKGKTRLLRKHNIALMLVNQKREDFITQS